MFHSNEFVNMVDVIELPRFLSNGIISFIRKQNQYMGDYGNLVLNIENDLDEALLPFQYDGIKFVIQHHGRGLIADEMGCGKTIQAIGLIQHYRNHWPVLVLVPVSLMDQWVKEILKFSSDLIRPGDINCIKKSCDPIHGQICIVPYTLIDKLVENDKITPEQFGVVIADECHNLKTRDAKRTLAALPFLKNANIAVCLSGTPATNRPVELYTQLNGLLPDVFYDYDGFVKRYCDAKPNPFGPGLDVKGCSNSSELKMVNLFVMFSVCSLVGSDSAMLFRF
jgi:SWI/SNF-related matrix-associated actin-dependent regulator 1 of chromatin subfamily A